MGSFKSSKCFIRGRIIDLTPEERVRQALLRKMVEVLGFPKGLISVERAIQQERRTDIVCYTKEMRPLLLIECKAGAIGERAVNQAIGYNDQVKAPFICLANAQGETTHWFEGKERKSIPFLPQFKELYAFFQNC
jgi:hypothetical protein